MPIKEYIYLIVKKGDVWSRHGTVADLDEGEEVFTFIRGDEDTFDEGDIDITGYGERELEIWFKDDITTDSRTSFDFVADVVVDDEARAKKGDVMAETGGDYDVTPDEIIVGVFGDFEITVTADDLETVYAGKTEQAIADITIAEDVAQTIVPGRVITLTLPDWAAWMEESMDDFDDENVDLNFRDIRHGGQQARFDVVGDFDDDRDTAAEIVLEDLEIALDTVAEGDVEVEVGGTAAVFGEVTVAEAKSPVSMEIDPLQSVKFLEPPLYR